MLPAAADYLVDIGKTASMKLWATALHESLPMALDMTLCRLLSARMVYNTQDAIPWPSIHLLQYSGCCQFRSPVPHQTNFTSLKVLTGKGSLSEESSRLHHFYLSA